MNVLARDASSVTVRARLDAGPWFTWNLTQWHLLSAVERASGEPSQAVIDRAFSTATATALTGARSLSATQAAALGWPAPAANTPLDGLLYFNPLSANLPHVTADGPVSETGFLGTRYALLVGTTWQQVNVLRYMLGLSATQLLSFVPEAADLSLLATVLRQSLLLEYAKAAGQVLGRPLGDPEQASTQGTLLWALGQTVYTPPVGLPSASGTLGDYIHTQVGSPAGQSAFPALHALRGAVQYLSTLSTAALDRVLIESLDVCGYRLDAWAVAVATSLLLNSRKNAATGIGLGAWGYVANLRPRAHQKLSDADLAELATALGAPAGSSPLPPMKDTTGFVLAPSLTHAATAAVLRNGYLSHSGGSYGGQFAVNLSSARVRHALYLMEGMRQGQPLGALLGYLFEQGLVDAHLQALQQPFRNAFPIIANKMTQYASASAESVAASNVVDGATLQRAWDGGTVPWGQGGLPAENAGDATYQALKRLLDQLSDRLDALNDIAVAESVYQLAKGNPVRSGGALNASSREQHPPEPQVVETPRTGLDLTQRILSCFAVNPFAPPASAWLGAQPATPRASAEPWLERWLGAILPSPGHVVFQLTYTSSAGATNTSGPLTLATMGMAALDLLALAPSAPTSAAAGSLDGSELVGSDLERWILFQCLKTGVLPTGASQPQLVYVPTTSLSPKDLTLPQLLTLARSAQELIGSARPVTPADFIAPSAQYPPGDQDLSGTAMRLAAAFAALMALNITLAGTVSTLTTATVSASDGDTLSGYLFKAAAFGFPGAAPVTTGRDSASLNALLGQAQQVSTAVSRRVTAVTGDPDLYAGGQLVLGTLTPGSRTPGQALQLAQATAQAIFGAKITILPVVTPTLGGLPPDPVAVATDEIAQAIASWTAAQHLTVAGALQQLTHVRPPVARLDEVMSLSAVLTGTPVPDLTVAQLGGSGTYSPTSPWLGAGPLTSVWPPGLPPQTLLGSYALLLWTPPALGPTTGPSMAGLFFDEWMEQIPSSVEKPAVAFHYDEPGARAPQSLLLAVSPLTRGDWTAQSVLSVVREAVALAKIRTVDPQTLESGGQVGQLLPALFAGFGPGTVSSLVPKIPTAVVATGA
jgi:hypothetical protein